MRYSWSYVVLDEHGDPISQVWGAGDDLAEAEQDCHDVIQDILGHPDYHDPNIAGEEGQ